MFCRLVHCDLHFVPCRLRAEDAKTDHIFPSVPRKLNGFRINSDLPREPYLPWNRWWWTRMFDAGSKWIRIGQYENSSDRNRWKWIDQQRGVLSSFQELEDVVDSLVGQRRQHSSAVCCTVIRCTHGCSRQAARQAHSRTRLIS